MADVFNINWVDRMKTDPKANSILNDKAKYESFYTYELYQRRHNRIGRRNRQRFVRRLNQLYSERYRKSYRFLGPIVLGERYRFDTAAFGRNTYTADNPEKYWENNIGAPLYKKDSIANAPNPHIEKLSYKE